MLDPLAKSTSDPVIPSAHFLISETSHQRPYKERRESLGSLGRSLSTSHLRVPSHSPFCCISRAPLKDNLSDRLLIFGRKFYLICLATLGTTFRIMPGAVCSCPSLMAMNTGLRRPSRCRFEYSQQHDRHSRLSKRPGSHEVLQRFQLFQPYSC